MQHFKLCGLTGSISGVLTPNSLRRHKRLALVFCLFAECAVNAIFTNTNIKKSIHISLENTRKGELDWVAEFHVRYEST